MEHTFLPRLRGGIESNAPNAQNLAPAVNFGIKGVFAHITLPASTGTEIHAAGELGAQ